MSVEETKIVSVLEIVLDVDRQSLMKWWGRGIVTALQYLKDHYIEEGTELFCVALADNNKGRT